GARSEGLDARVLRLGLDAGVDVDHVVVAGVGVAVVHRVVAVVELGAERVGRVQAVVDRVVRVLDVGVEAVAHRVVGDARLGGAVAGDLDGPLVARDRDVAGVRGRPVTEGDRRAVVGADGDVVGLDGAVPDHGLAQRGVLDLGEDAVALVDGDVVLDAVDDSAVAEHGVVGLYVCGVVVSEGDRTDLRVLDDLVPVTDHRVGHVAGHRAADVTGGDGRIGQVAAHLDGAVAGVDLGVVAGGHGTVTRHDVVVEVLVDVAEGGDVLVDRVVDGGVPVVDRRVVVVLELLVRDVQ